ncbi:MAG: zinc ABC transporter substrate-binding protein [Jatrophihabitantaceae bacterium]
MNRVLGGLVAAISVTAAAVGLIGCGTAPPARSQSGGAVIEVAASINAWGSILSQLGGVHVHATSIITNPTTDPHDYEASAADARLIANAWLFVENGIGYDSWAAKAVQANPDRARVLLDVGQVTGIAAGGNPHRWYSPADVDRVADAITAGLKRIDPADGSYYDLQRRGFESGGLAEYRGLIDRIKHEYAGTPVGASESIFAPLAPALGLDLITPASFLKAISEGTDPSPADKVTIDAQLREHKIKLYVYNSQNSTPDVSAQVEQARRYGIPVVAVTETLTPAGDSFQQWQSGQLKALAAALASTR